MKNTIIFFILIMIYNFQAVFSQTSSWSPVTRITNSKTQDRHPSTPERCLELRSSYMNLDLVFDRTDSIGTNICFIKTSGNTWAPEIQFVTSGSGLKEYPSIADSILVYQERNTFSSNIFYSFPRSGKWEKPMPLTNDSNKFNLFPKVYANSCTYPNKYITWEKDKKIYLKMFDGKKWSDELKISPNDSFAYSNPFFSQGQKLGYAVIYEKKINEKINHIMISHTNGIIYTIDTIYTIGLNKNPRFLNGWWAFLTWENKENDNWRILRKKISLQGTVNGNAKVCLGDSNNYNDFVGIINDNYTKLLNKDKKDDNSFFLDVNFLNCCAYIKSNNNMRSMILDGESFFNTEQNQAKNPTIGKYQIYMAQRVWAVWEHEENGYTNLYGSSYDIRFTGIEDKLKLSEFNLLQNYPNPFNPSTVVSFQLTVYSKITLKIFDILGREVRTLIDEYKPAGEHKVTFDAKGLSGGVYFYRLSAGGKIITRKMLLIK